MLAVLALLLLSLFSIAQPAATWYFAQDNGDLVAFTAEGAQQTVAPDFGEVQIGWRFDAQTALFLSEDGDEVAHLYRATPDGAAEIVVPGSPDLSNLRRLLDHSGDHVLLGVFTPGLFPTMGVLVNVADGTAEVLTHRVARVARFDGDHLRYVSVDEENHWSFVERDLTGSEKRTLHTFSAPPNASPFISANDTGTRWVFSSRDENRQLVNTLVNADGTTESLDSGTTEQPLAWLLSGDALISYAPLCETDCPVSLREGDNETTFTLAEGRAGIAVLAQPAPETLVIARAGSELLLLEAGSEPQPLGEYDPVSMMISGENLLSPDGRYLFSVTETDDSPRFLVSDLLNNALVYSATGGVGTQVLWFERGFVASMFGSDGEATAYFYDAGTSLVLPNRDAGVYFDILPDDRLLYALNREAEAVGAPGIYRYDPADGTYTLLLEGARPLYTAPLNS